MGSKDIIETEEGVAVHTNNGRVTTATKVKQPEPVAPPSPPKAVGDTDIPLEPANLPEDVQASRDATPPDLLKLKDELAVEAFGPVTPSSFQEFIELENGSLAATFKAAFNDTIGGAAFAGGMTEREKLSLQIKAANFTEDHGVVAFGANMIAGIAGEGFIDVGIALATAGLGELVIGAARAANASQRMIRLADTVRKVRQSYSFSGTRPGVASRLFYRSSYEFSTGAASAIISESILQSQGVNGRTGDVGAIFERAWVEGAFSAGLVEGGRQVFKHALPFVKSKLLKVKEEQFVLLEDTPSPADNTATRKSRRKKATERKESGGLSEAQIDAIVAKGASVTESNTISLQNILKDAPVEDVKGALTETQAMNLMKQDVADQAADSAGVDRFKVIEEPEPASTANRPRIEKKAKDIVQGEKLIEDTDLSKGQSIDELDKTVNVLETKRAEAILKKEKALEDMDGLLDTVGEMAESLIDFPTATRAQRTALKFRLSQIDTLNSKIKSLEQIVADADALSRKFDEALFKLDDSMENALADLEVNNEPLGKGVLVEKNISEGEVPVTKKSSPPETRKTLRESRRKTDAAVRDALDNTIDSAGIRLSGLKKKNLVDTVSSFLKKSHKKYASFLVDLIDARAKSAGFTLSQYLDRNGISLKSASGVKVLIRDGAHIINAIANGTDISDLVHELAHVIRTDLDAGSLAIIERQLGITKWDRAAEEKFADLLVEHIRDRVDTPSALKAVFNKAVGFIDRIKSFLITDGNKEAARKVFSRLFEATDRPFAVPTDLKNLNREVTSLNAPKKKRAKKIAGAEIGVDIPGEKFLSDAEVETIADVKEANKAGGTIDTSPGKAIPRFFKFFGKLPSLLGFSNVNTFASMTLAGKTFEKHFKSALVSRSKEASIRQKGVKVFESAVDRTGLTNEGLIKLRKDKLELDLPTTKETIVFRKKKDGTPFKNGKKTNVDSSTKVTMSRSEWLHLHLTAADTFGNSSGAHSLSKKGYMTSDGVLLRFSKEQVKEMASDRSLAALGSDAKKLKSVLRSTFDYTKTAMNNAAVARGMEAPLSKENTTFYPKATKGQVNGKPNVIGAVDPVLSGKGGRLILGEQFARKSFNLQRRGAGVIHPADAMNVLDRQLGEMSKTLAWSDTGAKFAVLVANTRNKIEDVFGRKFAAQMENIAQRMNDSVPSSELDDAAFSQFALQAQAVHALWGNVGVFVKQNVSGISAAIEGNAHFAAFKEANPDWIKTLYKEALDPASHKRLMEIDPIYADRWNTGSSTPNTNESIGTGMLENVLSDGNSFAGATAKMKEGGFGTLKGFKELGLLPIKMVDALTVRFVRGMAERSVDPSLSGKAKEAAIRTEFNRLVVLTQPTFDKVFKTANQSSSNLFVRFMSQFSSQPSKHFGLLLVDFAKNEQMKISGTDAQKAAASKKLNRTAKLLMLNAGAFAALGTLYGISKESALSLLDSKADARKREKALEQYGNIFQKYIETTARTVFGTVPVTGGLIGELGIATVGGKGFGSDIPVLEAFNGVLKWVDSDDKISPQGLSKFMKATGSGTGAPRILTDLFGRAIGSGEK